VCGQGLVPLFILGLILLWHLDKRIRFEGTLTLTGTDFKGIGFVF